jgi:hypothetical protein
MVKINRNPEFIRQIFAKEKRKIFTFPKSKHATKILTTKRLIPYVMKDALGKINLRVNYDNLEHQLNCMLENKTLGPTLNLAMKNKLEEMFEHESLTPQEIEIADEINMLDEILGDSKHTQKFLNIFGQELLDVYSRERTDPYHQNH